MNTDKIYAEQLANEYAPKDTSKVRVPFDFCNPTIKVGIESGYL